MNKIRLDQALVVRNLVVTRSQAESYIKLGTVTVDGRIVTKPGFLVGEGTNIRLTSTEQYVSRAGLKLASVAETLQIDFRNKIVLDIGSSTGGFTDYALRHGARKVIAVDVGTKQLHQSLRGNPNIELHEQTDIRDFKPTEQVDIIVADLSFISLREILLPVATFCGPETQIIAMAKPQFEASQSSQKHKGVIKNDRLRRDILRDFETWAVKYFIIHDKADSDVAGAKGNRERFYKLQKIHRS